MPLLFLEIFSHFWLRLKITFIWGLIFALVSKREGQICWSVQTSKVMTFNRAELRKQFIIIIHKQSGIT